MVISWMKETNRIESIPKIRNRFVFMQLWIFDIFWWSDLKIINKDGNHYSWIEWILANVNIENIWVMTQIGNEVLISILLHISWFNMKSMWNIIESLNHWIIESLNHESLNYWKSTLKSTLQTSFILYEWEYLGMMNSLKLIELLVYLNWIVFSKSSQIKLMFGF